jgi:hypothetical protein
MHYNLYCPLETSMSMNKSILVCGELTHNPYLWLYSLLHKGNWTVNIGTIHMQFPFHTSSS